MRQDTCAVRVHAGYRRAGVRLDPLRFESPGQGKGDDRFFVGQQCAALHGGDLHAESGEHLPQFDPDWPTANYDQRCWKTAQVLAVVLVSGSTDSTPGMAGTAGLAPVASRIFLAR